ncbi:MAG TPA: universal stress protein [Candidatus Acidoferrum sp.]|nr:universal stress protein [Candidatus Acidoferrum sp.]
MNFRNVLIAVDSGPVAAHAAEVGSALARSLGGTVALIHAVDPALAVPPESGLAASELVALAQQDGKRLLAGFCGRLSLPATTLEFVEVGAPAETIVKAAKDWPADIIVIGSHGRGGVRRALVGSVAEAVMRHATCPVLVIRAKE